MDLFGAILRASFGGPAVPSPEAKARGDPGAEPSPRI